MENASKALIIAGAILLSILIIGIGMTIYKQATGVLNNNSMDEQEIAAYNETFESYEGTNVKGAKVQALVQAVNNHNRTADESRKIVIVDPGKGNSLTEDYSADDANKDLKGETYSKSKYQTGKTYIISFAHDSKTGLLTKIGIAETN